MCPPRIGGIFSVINILGRTDGIDNTVLEQGGKSACDLHIHLLCTLLRPPVAVAAARGAPGAGVGGPALSLCQQNFPMKAPASVFRNYVVHRILPPFYFAPRPPPPAVTSPSHPWTNVCCGSLGQERSGG